MKFLSYIFSITSLYSSSLIAQNQIEFTSELFQIFLEETKLTVKSNHDNEIYSKEFQNPSAHLFDLDNDGVNEFLVEDSIASDDSVEFLLYIYNLLDTFYLAAEINSGIIYPFQTVTGEIEGLIIVTGNSDFSYLNKGSKVKYLPINCWKFEDGEVYLVNEELYEIFVSENENLLMRNELKEMNDCSESLKLKSLLASVYINYMSAGEIASAENLMETFYLCDDRESFRNELENIFNQEN